MKILVTGAAGFIGAAVCRRLLDEGCEVVGIDNINDYYDPDLKLARLSTLDIGASAMAWGCESGSESYAGFTFIRMNLEDEAAMERLFAASQFDVVVNLAAQAGVRYSIDHPRSYVQSNVVGFLNVLEGCRHSGVKHLVYASSSSVYGLNTEMPFREADKTDRPASLYAATKKSNELMAHAYSHLYGLRATGLRFFTVYGPWGRPDMSPFLFIDAILHGRTVKVFNGGDMMRDFTYIDDVVEAVVRISTGESGEESLYNIYNVGNQQPTCLLDYITCIERSTGVNAIKQMLPMQAGDVKCTAADSSSLYRATGFTPHTPLQDGIDKTVAWFRSYYNI